MRTASLVCALIALIVTPSRAADAPVTDLDKRAGATLYSTYAEKPVPPESMTQAQLKGLTRFEHDAKKNSATYSLDYGAVTGTTDNRGYMRITVNEPPVDVLKAGWTLLRTDPTSGAEIVWKKVERSDADKYLQIGVRRKFGNIILAVSQRQPIDMPPDKAAVDVHARFVRLLAYAKQWKLFGGQIKLTLMSRSDQPEMGSDEPLEVSLSDNAETSMLIRIEAYDEDGKLRNDVKRFDLQVNGTLAKQAKLKVAGELVDLSKPVQISDPKTPTEVTLILPKGTDDAAQDALYLGVGKSDPPIALKVGAEFK